jgi:hypothetical protein
MGSIELIQYQLEIVGFQVEKVFEGLPENLYEATLSPDLMSPRLTLAHFLELFEAIEKQLNSETHEWGSYLNKQGTFQSLFTEYQHQRSKTISNALESKNVNSLKLLSDYIVLHESYHVGQLCSLRIAHDKNFNPLSIYRHS